MSRFLGIKELSIIPDLLNKNQLNDRIISGELELNDLLWLSGNFKKVTQADIDGISAVSKVIFDGDSLEYGDGVDHLTESYPAVIKAETLAGGNFIGYDNLGVSGQTVDQMLSDQSSQVLPLHSESNTFNILVVGGGTNNFRQGESASSIYAKLKTYHNNAVAAGFKTIALTHSSFNNDTYATPNATAVDIVRMELADLIRDGWKRDFGASALVDIASDQHLGVFDVEDFDLDYFTSDGVHLSVGGNAYKAGLILPAIEAIANGLEYGDVTPLLSSIEGISWEQLIGATSTDGTINCAVGSGNAGGTASKAMGVDGILQYQLSSSLSHNNAVVACLDVSNDAQYGWLSGPQATPVIGVFYFAGKFYKTTGPHPAATPEIASASAGDWIRISREGNKVFIKKSANKINWTIIDEAVSPVPRTQELFIKVFFAAPGTDKKLENVEGYNLVSI